MTLQEILNVTTTEFKTLSPERQRGYVQFLSMEANKRMTQIENANLEPLSYAYIDAKESGGRFSSKGKDPKELKSEFIRAKKFLKSESSTVTGAVNTTMKPIETAMGRKYDKKERRKIAGELAAEVNELNRSAFSDIDTFFSALWKIVEKARELGAEAYAKSNELIQMAYKAVMNPKFLPGEDIDDYVDRIAQEITERLKEVRL